jgi:hypothetical protein
MSRFKAKTIIPANAGFYMLGVVDEATGVVPYEIVYDPVVAWAIDEEGVVLPVAYGGDVPCSEDCDPIVLCPNGRVNSRSTAWSSLEEWFASVRRDYLRTTIGGTTDVDN